MNDGKSLRIMVVDDTVVYRKIVSDVISDIPGMEVVGIANNGKIALNKINSLKPDLLTLDIEMPEVNGLEVLEVIKNDFPELGAIMVSTLTRKGGDMTMKSLELGAFDFIAKPQSGTMEENRETIKRDLAPMLKAFYRRKEIKELLGRKSVHNQAFSGGSNKLSGEFIRRGSIATGKRARSEIIGIGVSTGGPNALSQMMPKLPGNLGVPILIVQHMPAVFTQSMAKSLNSKCDLEVREASDGESIRSDTALIAPGGKQMKVVAGADGKSRIVRITDDPPENSCKPSVDYLFRSLARHYVGRATGIIMTGMGTDGTLGMKLMKKNGATTIAQDELSCVVYGMPKESIEAGVVDIVAPLDRIADEIRRVV